MGFEKWSSGYESANEPVLYISAAYDWGIFRPNLELQTEKYNTSIDFGVQFRLFDDRFLIGLGYGKNGWKAGMSLNQDLFSDFDGGVSYGLFQEKFTGSLSHSFSVNLTKASGERTTENKEVTRSKPERIPEPKEPQENERPSFAGVSLITSNGVNHRQYYASNLVNLLTPLGFAGTDRENYENEDQQTSTIYYTGNNSEQAKYINEEYLGGKAKIMRSRYLPENTIKIIIGRDIINLLE